MRKTAYNVEMRAYGIVGWVALLAFGAGAVGAFFSGEPWPALGFGAFSAGGVYLILGAGRFDFTNEAIRHKSFWGTWKISWEEISHAEIGETDGTIVFYGCNKRFVLSPPSWWSGSDKEGALAFIEHNIKQRGIIISPSKSAAYKIMKNTKLRDGQV